MSRNLSELSSRKGMEDNLFQRIGELAEPGGTPETNRLTSLADEFLVGHSSLHGTVSFYDFLKPENKGKTVYICNGTACECAGTQDHVKKVWSDKIGSEKIGHMTCLGRCHENSAFQYMGRNYSGKDINKIDTILDHPDLIEEDRYPVKATGKAILSKSIPEIDLYYAPLKKVLAENPEKILHEIELSGLRGRGGAGFPMGIKLRSCRAFESDVKFIICNADEGDPGAYSDRFLLEKRPHAVLFGMLVSGYITGANHGIVYIRAEYPESVTNIKKAIDDLANHGLIGKNIMGKGFHFDISIVKARGAYICGEETALLNSIEGQRPEVRIRPPYPVQEGLFNKPTVVNNVETLAALHYITITGGNAWKLTGTKSSSGTKLMSLDGFFKNPGIYEVEMGTPFEELVYTHGGGFTKKVKALQVGGPLGGLVPVSLIKDLTIDFESFSKNGFLLGHASVICIPEQFPMIQYLAHLLTFAAYESCGKCFPCRLGTQRGKELLENAITGNYKIDQELFEDLLTTLEEGSLCAHGGGIPLPVRNALHYFRDELEPFFQNQSRR